MALTLCWFDPDQFLLNETPSKNSGLLGCLKGIEPEDAPELAPGSYNDSVVVFGTHLD
jgi:hypothetical protein